MRFAMLMAALAVAAPAALQAQPFEGQGLLFGRYHVYQGAWCGHEDTGGGNVQEDCSFDTFEHCRFVVVGANNGFCTPNPGYAGPPPPLRKKKRHHAAR
jgi:hypothetical protein